MLDKSSNRSKFRGVALQEVCGVACFSRGLVSLCFSRLRLYPICVITWHCRLTEGRIGSYYGMRQVSRCNCHNHPVWPRRIVYFQLVEVELDLGRHVWQRLKISTRPQRYHLRINASYETYSFVNLVGLYRV
jgi:hypothetical protein